MDASLSDAVWNHCEEVIHRFESAWQQSGRPDMALFLPSSQDFPIQLLVELVQIDLEFRFRNNEIPALEEYLHQFPALDDPVILLDMIVNEYHLKNRYQLAPTVDEYVRRFPQLKNEILKALSVVPDHNLSTTVQRVNSTDTTGLPNIPGYIVGEEVGRGGMGVVYRAEQPTLNRTVAIKTFAYIPGIQESMRFHREAEAIARLDHPHIVPVYEIGQWNVGRHTVPFFIMKWYPGGSLDALSVSLGTDFHAKAGLIESVAHAIQHAHERGVLHRDIKPSNILLDERGNPCVADFGLARWYDASNPKPLTAAIVGTPSYMAPEQARHPESVTTSADVYGIGAVLYQLLVGKPPFLGESVLAILEQVMNASPAPPINVNPRIPRDLSTICMKCLEKNPSERYRSAEALAEDIHCWRTGRPIQARSAGAFEKLWRLIKRYPMAASFCIATVITLFTLVAVLIVSNLEIRERESETYNALSREKATNETLAAALEREQQLLYLERVASASHMWDTNQLPQFWNLLESCPVKYRNWEWHYLNSLRRFQSYKFSGHTEWIQTVTFLSGNRILSGDGAGMVFIWDSEKMQELTRFSAGIDNRPVTGSTTDKHGKWFAITNSNSLTIWDAEQYKLTHTLEGQSWVTLSHDGRTLATTLRSEVLLYDTETWINTGRLKGHSQRIINASFTPDNKQLVTSSMDKSIRIWNCQNHSQEKIWIRSAPVLGAVFTPDGQRLIESLPQTLNLVDSKSGKVIQTISKQLSGRVYYALANNTNVLAASGANAEIQLHFYQSNKSTQLLKGHSFLVTALAFSQDDRWLVTAGSDRTVQLWDLSRNYEEVPLARMSREVADISLSPDGSKVACIHAATTTSGRTGIMLLDAQTGQSRFQYTGNYDVQFLPNSCHIVFCKNDGNVSLTDTVSHQEIRLFPKPRADAYRLAVSGDGKMLAAASMDDHVVIWNVDTGNELFSFQTGLVRCNSIAFSPDGNRLAIGGRSGMDIWYIPGRKRASSFPFVRSGRILRFTPDGESFASIEADRILRIRKCDTGEIILALGSTAQQLTSLIIHPDGTRLATHGMDGFVRIWDTQTGKELLALQAGAGVLGMIAWDQSGKQLFATDTHLRKWSTNKEQ